MLRSIKMAVTSTEKLDREKLLKTVKKEVKQIMEEAVTRKFVHEGSSSVTSLCAAIEGCLSHGLKRRALGLFKTNSTTALLHKVAKQFDPAAVISQLVLEFENGETTKTPSSGESSSKNLTVKKQPSVAQYVVRYLWIRLALFEKQLSKIIDFLVENSSKYYEKYALVADPVDGPILASLLVGPCALDYSKMKTQDHLWTDLPADELVQRHRISAACHPSPTCTTPPSGRRPGLLFRRPPSSGGATDDNFRMVPLSARDYVEFLHQNSKATLLYGKNNVIVQPKVSVDPIPGYLSLHQSADQLAIKWTPNQLMNGCDDSAENLSKDDKSVYWEYALNVNIDEIVYVHCHQQADCGGTIVLVGQDGVQHPPIHFPKGGHLLAFLSCLENGLLPHGQLDPPLWSQRGRVVDYKQMWHQSIGKVFPKLRRKGKGSPAIAKDESSSMENEDETADFVFRIITSLRPEFISQEMMDPRISRSVTPGAGNQTDKKKGSYAQHTSSRSSSSNSSAKSMSLTEEYAEMQRQINSGAIDLEQSGGLDTLQVLCNTMKRQIISRAFYGWLAHCRHLRTVRTHLSGLVHTTIVSVSDPSEATGGLTKERWETIQSSGEVDAMEVYRLIYFGGMEHCIRKEVWPYLLGHYIFGSNAEERKLHDEDIQHVYETTMTEWLAVEAIVRQRDKEIVAAQMAKLSSESTNGEIPLIGKDQTLSNDVFEDGDSDGAIGSEDEDELSDSRNKTDEHQQHSNRIRASSVDLTPDEGMAEEEHDVESEQTVQSDGEKSSKPDRGDSVESNAQVGAEEEEEEKKQEKLDWKAVKGSSSGEDEPQEAMELLDTFAINLHRIDKDVQRCDRNYCYFTTDNLEKLRNVMCTYVWEHLEIGYVQGMCDLVAPLLVIFDDEAKTYSCFCQLMKRMSANFPHGGAMDSHFANMRSLIQILDSEMFELMHQNGDYTHFYFCYRWFLLDFKRELVYDDVFSVWETIWAATHVASSHFVLFIALALVEYYRDVILDNNMDFTDIIKFFNEMAERHNAKSILKVARDLVLQLQNLIDNK
ncbi:hypothetical protein CHUAL_005806 [Chamberlinius hualienensis]